MDEGHASAPDREATPTASFGTPQVSFQAPARGRSRARRGWRWLVAIVLTIAASAVAGCGSSTSLLTSSSSSSATTRTAGSTRTAAKAAAPAVCSSSARAEVAGAASVAAGAVSEKAGTSSEATPQCAFRAGRLKVVAIVDSGPQPYFRLERTVVEAQQQFSTVRLEPAPVHVGGLGLDADWFPKEKQIMTTDGNRLITVGVRWRGMPTKRQIALAKVIAHTYLGPNNPKAAFPNGS